MKQKYQYWYQDKYCDEVNCVTFLLTWVSMKTMSSRLRMSLLVFMGLL